MKEDINKIEAEKFRERVDKLAEGDMAHEDSVRDVASKEDKFRENLKKEALDQGAVAKLADIYSDEVLEKFEARKERWIDDLTGLRNKNALKEEIPQLLSSEYRQKKDCSILMVDFDHFKKINDELGHNAGDQALKKLAQILKNQARAADIVYRYGGEELFIFLPNTNSSQAAMVAERIRAAVKNTEIELIDSRGQKQHLNKTVSIGCVGTDQLKEWDSFKDEKVSDFLETIIIDADMAMYNAKKISRDRVVVYNEKLNLREEDKGN